MADLYLEDEYGNGLKIDEKHCTDDEIRLVIGHGEFYLTRAIWRQVDATIDRWEGPRRAGGA